jgi:hypothetical protein
MNNKIKKITPICTLMLAMLNGAALADNDPKDYTQFPAGTNFMTLYLAHSWGDELYAQGNKTADDYKFRLYVGVAKLTSYRTFGSRLFVGQIALPYGNVSIDWDSAGFQQSSTQIGDPTALVGLWPYTSDDKKFQLGISGWVTAPLGEYDSNKAVNLGANRWVFKPETNITYQIKPGLFLETAAVLQIYTDNDDYLGSQIFEQNPVLTIEGHISKDVTSKLNISLYYFHHNGGETTIAGATQNNPKNDHSLQTSLGYLFDSGVFTRIAYRNNFIVENGEKTQSAVLSVIKAF